MSLDSLSRLPGLHRTHRTDIKSSSDSTRVMELMHVLKRYACIIRFSILNQMHRLNEGTVIAIKGGRSSSCNQAMFPGPFLWQKLTGGVSVFKLISRASTYDF